MPLPSFPATVGVPGDGDLVALYGGGPPSIEILGGQIAKLQVVESYPAAPAVWPDPSGYFGQSLIADGITLWLSGSLLLDAQGAPPSDDWADMLARFAAARDKMKLANYEFFMYYHPASPTTYRKLKSVNTVRLRSYWSNPVTLNYVLAAVTTDKNIYATAPGV